MQIYTTITLLPTPNPYLNKDSKQHQVHYIVNNILIMRLIIVLEHKLHCLLALSLVHQVAVAPHHHSRGSVSVHLLQEKSQLLVSFSVDRGVHSENQ